MTGEFAFGRKVCASGTVVIITAEDDEDEIHRRLEALDPGRKRSQDPARLIVVALPNTGGVLTLLRGGYAAPELTDECTALREQLKAIPDLTLIVFDPFQAFVAADVNKDPAAGQTVCTLMGQIAAETGAAVIVTHHFRKQGEIRKPSDARDAVRGSTALTDGMRSVYALWAAGEAIAKKVCRELGRKFEENIVYRGAIVKANWPADLQIRSFVRNEIGLLCDVTDSLIAAGADREHLLEELELAIASAAVAGKPYTKTGRSGVYQRRNELSPGLKRIGRNRLEDMGQELLDADRVTQSLAAKGGRSVQWLDVPGGPFDRGDGEFRAGSMKTNTE